MCSQFDVQDFPIVSLDTKCFLFYYLSSWVVMGIFFYEELYVAWWMMLEKMFLPCWYGYSLATPLFLTGSNSGTWKFRFMFLFRKLKTCRVAISIIRLPLVQIFIDNLIVLVAVMYPSILVCCGTIYIFVSGSSVSINLYIGSCIWVCTSCI